jgi:outer membrane protein assembly factor BamB
MQRKLLQVSLMTALFCSTALAGQDAAQIVAQSGVKGGVVVHLGCRDGTLTTALRTNDGYVVHGLDTDAAQVAVARKQVLTASLYGKVAFDTFNGQHLPYIDNMVNLLVVEEGAFKGADDELLRVLAPNGVVLFLNQQSQITNRKLTKPRPPQIDEWTHYLHDPGNNAVANDTVVAPPRHLQWEAGPKWTRHHDHMSSLSAMVTCGGRIFYIIDEGLFASIYLPSHWALVARDAFNGKLLWKREINDWYTRFKGLKDGPADAPRRLVAVDNRVYVMLSLHGTVACLNGETGETIREYPETKESEEILLADGTLFVLCGTGSLGDGGRLERPVEQRTLMAFEADSGKKIWQTSDVVAALTPAVGARHAYYFNFEKKHVVALDRQTGKPVWTSEPLPVPARQTSFFASKLVVKDGVVLLASGEVSGMIKSTGGATKDDTLTALDGATGKTLWKANHPPSGYSSPENVFVIDGTVWCDSSSNGSLDGTVVGYDLKTGAEKARFPCDQKNYWFHHRCYPGRASTNYLMTSRTGIEFIDFRKKQWDLNHWARGACLYGIMPANGLIYTPPAPCICYAETYLHSFNAYAPAKAGETAATPATPRLEKGPAFAQPFEGKAAPDDWPTYRCDNARSGATGAKGPAELSKGWTADLGGKLSSAVVADGKVFVAAIDVHTVHALDAASGRKLWQYTAGGRIDSPPTCVEGRVLFGSNDGYVYCLRASDGATVWRFRAAPVDRRILCYEQIESLWPVHGNVMVREGIAHFVAGRSAFVDGGLRLFRVRVASGEVVSETPMDNRNPETGKDMQELVKWLNMPVARPDILSCDGQRIYMRSQSFDLEGKRLHLGPTETGPNEGKLQGGEGTHLFCPTGFLDDTWFHRTYWLFAKTWSSGWNGYYIAGKFAPGGRIMSVGQDEVFAFDRQPQYYKWTTPMEYRLYAARKEWKPGDKADADQGGGGGDDEEKPARKAATRKAGKKADKSEPAPVTNKGNYAWTTGVPILVRAMVLTGTGKDGTLFIAGPSDLLDESGLGRKEEGSEELVRKQEAAYLGQSGGVVWAVSAGNGEKKAELALDAPPVFDGMAAAQGKLFIVTMDGKVICLGKP